MIVKNFTPFPNLKFVNSDPQGREFNILFVKGTFVFDQSDQLKLAPEQEPLNLTDSYHGNLGDTSVAEPSDLVAYKPRTDFIMNATAFAPEGKPTKRWLVGFQVKCKAGEVILEKTLQITGPRFWSPMWKRKLSEEEQANWREHLTLFERWELSEPDPTDKLPIRYEYAFGGSLAKGEDENDKPTIEAFENNPIGIGMLDSDWSDLTRSHPAPQIENPNNPITAPYKLYPPEGFGPIPPAWQPRRRLGGTYDQHWLDHVHPDWPEDYDFAYHNSAHPDLISRELLQQAVKVHLAYLRPKQAQFKFNLPDLCVFAMMDPKDDQPYPVRMALDTVLFDMADPDLSQCRVYTTWRLVYLEDKFDEMQLRLPSKEERDMFEGFPGLLRSAPSPDQLFEREDEETREATS